MSDTPTREQQLEAALRWALGFLRPLVKEPQSWEDAERYSAAYALLSPAAPPPSAEPLIEHEYQERATGSIKVCGYSRWPGIGAPDCGQPREQHRSSR